ncbi:MAG: hypothetical protein KZQ99_17755 [Candidatus Thiodiazotropha sp. (ex Dulcina madagascariensis)]|nr:hypothetical protein [Candidatus Thiodiazotropha sp. (ex Dulcina madagascariensis)]
MPHSAEARTATRDRDAGRYQRHRPEQTLLYRIIEQHYPAFIAHLAVIWQDFSGQIITQRFGTLCHSPMASGSR